MHLRSESFKVRSHHKTIVLSISSLKTRHFCPSLLSITVFLHFCSISPLMPHTADVGELSQRSKRPARGGRWGEMLEGLSIPKAFCWAQREWRDEKKVWSVIKNELWRRKKQEKCWLRTHQVRNVGHTVKHQSSAPVMALLALQSISTPAPS